MAVVMKRGGRERRELVAETAVAMKGFGRWFFDNGGCGGRGLSVQF